MTNDFTKVDSIIYRVDFGPSRQIYLRFVMPTTKSGDTSLPSHSGLSARERILITAHELFYSQGLRATGIDSIIAASGVAKLTFYRHFSAKDIPVS